MMSIYGQNSAQEAAYAFLTMVGLLILPTALIIRMRIPGPYRFRRNLLPPMLRFGLPSIAASFPVILNLRLDQFIMAAFLLPEVLGLYVVAVAWASAVSPVINTIDSIIFPRVASQLIPSESIRILIQGIHMAVLIGLILIVTLLIITPYILPLIFGNNFKQAVPAAMILIVAGVITNINNVMENGHAGLGKPVIALLSESIGLIATIVALIFLLRPLGIIGAAISSLLGYSSIMLA